MFTVNYYNRFIYCLCKVSFCSLTRDIYFLTEKSVKSDTTSSYTRISFELPVDGLLRCSVLSTKLAIIRAKVLTKRTLRPLRVASRRRHVTLSLAQTMTSTTSSRRRLVAVSRSRHFRFRCVVKKRRGCHAMCVARSLTVRRC